MPEGDDAGADVGRPDAVFRDVGFEGLGEDAKIGFAKRLFCEALLRTLEEPGWRGRPAGR